MSCILSNGNMPTASNSFCKGYIIYATAMCTTITNNSNCLHIVDENA